MARSIMTDGILRFRKERNHGGKLKKVAQPGNKC